MEEKIRDIMKWYIGGSYRVKQEAVKQILALFDINSKEKLNKYYGK